MRGPLSRFAILPLTSRNGVCSGELFRRSLRRAMVRIITDIIRVRSKDRVVKLSTDKLDLVFGSSLSSHTHVGLYCLVLRLPILFTKNSNCLLTREQ